MNNCNNKLTLIYIYFFVIFQKSTLECGFDWVTIYLDILYYVRWYVVEEKGLRNTGLFHRYYILFYYNIYYYTYVSLVKYKIASDDIITNNKATVLIDIINLVKRVGKYLYLLTHLPTYPHRDDGTTRNIVYSRQRN